MQTSKVLLGIPLFMLSMPSFGFCESYVGLGIGPENVNFKQKAQVINRPPSADARVIDKTQFGGQGGFGSIFAGIAYRFAGCDPNCDNLYLGGEINFNFRTLKFKSTNEEFVNFNFNHNTYRMRRDYGISLLPGILFSDCTLFYARLGYSNGRFVSDTTDTSLQSLSKNRNGFRYGLGFRQGFNACWAFRIEYNQIDYQKVKMQTFDPVGNVLKNTSITPHTQRFELGLMYTF